jgi:hypothetical protein
MTEIHTRVSHMLKHVLKGNKALLEVGEGKPDEDPEKDGGTAEEHISPKWEQEEERCDRERWKAVFRRKPLPQK